jgi:hypothetical protein
VKRSTGVSDVEFLQQMTAIRLLEQVNRFFNVKEGKNVRFFVLVNNVKAIANQKSSESTSEVWA